jgi:nicotinate-nucleotide pyrophosphorylase (carboxylating)
MSPREVAVAVARVPSGTLVEASGGITLDNVAEYARAEVDLISVGAITHSAGACDVSLEVEPS